MTRITDEELVRALREPCRDWGGEWIVRDSTPRYAIHCGLLYDAADRLASLAKPGVTVKPFGWVADNDRWREHLFYDEAEAQKRVNIFGGKVLPVYSSLPLPAQEGESITLAVLDDMDNELARMSSVITSKELIDRTGGNDGPVNTTFPPEMREHPTPHPASADKLEVVAYLVDCPVAPTLEFANVHVPDAANPLVFLATATRLIAEKDREIERLEKDVGGLVLSRLQMKDRYRNAAADASGRAEAAEAQIVSLKAEHERMRKVLLNLEEPLARDMGTGYAGVALIRAALAGDHDGRG